MQKISPPLQARAEEKTALPHPPDDGDAQAPVPNPLKAFKEKARRLLKAKQS